MSIFFNRSKKQEMIEYEILIKCNKRQLKTFLNQGHINQKTLVKDNARSGFIELNCIEELKDLFTTDPIQEEIKANKKAIKDNADIIIEAISNLMSDKKFSKKETSKVIEEEVIEAVNAYLQNHSSVYLTTGFTNDKKPAYLILIKDNSNRPKIDCEIPIDSEDWSADELDKWPDLAKKTARVWEMSN